MPFIQIPDEVQRDRKLSPNAKLIYGNIFALCQLEGFCWASNQYFAEIYGVRKEQISRWITELRAAGYVTVELEYKKGTLAIDKRIVKLRNRYCAETQEGIGKKDDTPIAEKRKENIQEENIKKNREINKSESVKAKIPTNGNGNHNQSALTLEQRFSALQRGQRMGLFAGVENLMALATARQDGQMDFMFTELLGLEG